MFEYASSTAVQTQLIEIDSIDLEDVSFGHLGFHNYLSGTNTNCLCHMCFGFLRDLQLWLSVAIVEEGWRVEGGG